MMGSNPCPYCEERFETAGERWVHARQEHPEEMDTWREDRRAADRGELP